MVALACEGRAEARRAKVVLGALERAGQVRAEVGRAGRDRVLLAQNPEHGAQVGDRLVTHGDDVLQRRRHLIDALRVAQLGLGLLGAQNHLGVGAGEGVVQLARDEGPLSAQSLRAGDGGVLETPIRGPKRQCDAR